MGPALARALEARPRLSAATDELNKRLAEAEAALIKLNLGVRAEVTMRSPGDHYQRILSFAKHSDDWRLLYEYGPFGGDVEVMPLLNSPRSMRLQAVEHLPELLEKLTTNLMEEVKRVEERSEEAGRFLGSLKEVTPASPEPEPWDAVPPPGDEDAPF